MARKAMIEKAKKVPKYKVRKHNRCNVCGRSRAYIRDFGICRICFRKLAGEGKLPGIKKASW
ncbi:MAG: type Z 30S ribosomal protein S14 [Spirochaetes bacterium]|nr:type Z 30S ribosomal protein S14 [Spirochaetota bacterium]